MSKIGLIKSTYYPNFDWLRLLLAIQVVAIHAGVAPTVFMNPVPAFLAISGFVVLSSMERRPIGQFFISRALRVLPPLFLSFLVIGIFWSPEDMVKNIIFWLWPTPTQTVNPVVWTLIYEEAFYAILAILFSIGAYKRKVIPVFVCGCIMGMTFSYNFYVLSDVFYMLGAAFFLGNVMYLFREFIFNTFNKWVVTALFLLSVIAVYSLPYSSLVRKPLVYIDFFAFAAMIAFAIAGPKLPRLKIDLSYSLYLFHCLVLAQFSTFIPLGNKLFWVVFFSSLPICFLSWYAIEKPALAFKSKFGDFNQNIEDSKNYRTVDSDVVEMEKP
jgi:peptidoglycan/LPS O-acetylase OafA/YrhL